jgi:hypothetical protein
MFYPRQTKWRGNLFIFVLLTFFTIPESTVFAQDTLWTRNYGGSSFDGFNSLDTTADGNLITVGSTVSFGAGSWDVWLVKFNPDGDTVWAKTYGDANSNIGQVVRLCNDGGFIIAGRRSYYVQPDSYYEGYLLKTNSSGDLEWEAFYDGSAIKEVISGFDSNCGNERGMFGAQFTDVVQNDEGGFVVGGYIYTFGPDYHDAFLIRYTYDGDIDFTHDPEPSYFVTWPERRLYSIDIVADGGYMVSGSIDDMFEGGSDSIWVAKTDANFDKLWEHAYKDTKKCASYSLSSAGDGNFVMAGFMGDHYLNEEDAFLSKIDNVGDTAWLKTFGTSQNDKFNAVSYAQDGGFIAVGTREGGVWSSGCNAWIVKTDDMGILDWSYEIEPDSEGWLKDVVQISPTDYIAIGGFLQTDDPSVTDAWIIRLTTSSGIVCGDANGDGAVNVGDAVYLIAYVFKGGPAPDPVCAGDANGDGDTNVGDAVYLIAYVFKGGPAPVEPCCP